jgi:iron-sulfur cluster repair protein YtfE (RIC family)|tara:strand:- start:23907 stop:24371 length:465 start_codon:yes stop_codon:yes gene_type:complete
METPKPIKRHEALKPLSRQHHFGLLFSWKIRKGFSADISLERMKKYADWFFETEIKPHFKAEEEHIFPILDKEDEMVKRALKEHERIEKLFKDTIDPKKSLRLLEEELQAHIRFEERIMFNEIQKVATAEQLKTIEKLHIDDTPKTDYNDPFWK